MTIASLVRLFALLALALPSLSHAQRQPALRVIRVTPSNNASPLAQLSVTFDRPVAGSIDRAVDPATVLSVNPAIAGRIEWRDPVTVRFVPASPLAPGARYTVTVANTFRAMDGSALAEPYRFSFRVEGPTLLSGFPVSGNGERALHVTPNQDFTLIYSAPVDLGKLSTAAHIEFTAACTGQRIVRLRAVSQREIAGTDPWMYRQAGGYERDRLVDSLRRVVRLVPQTPLPLECEGELVAPAEVEDQFLSTTERWPFRTYGDFRIMKLACAAGSSCPTGPLQLTFSNPVRGADVMRRIRILPDVKFTLRDTLSESTDWILEATLSPRTSYAVSADTALRDVFGQRLSGNPARGYATTGYAPTLNYPFGKLLVERVGFRTLSVQHVNTDTIVAAIAPIPLTHEARVLSRFGWFNDTIWNELMRGATTQRVAGGAQRDQAMVTGVRLPLSGARGAASPTLYAVRLTGRTAGRDTVTGPVAILQITDLGVHARIGETEGAVWVTGVSDGVPRAGASVTLYDRRGRLLATSRTDARGLARLVNFTSYPSDSGATDNYEFADVEGYVKVSLGDDQAIASINSWDPDLSPWRFNVPGAWGNGRLPLAGAVFTERGIYRPGERLHAKAILRDGSLGALRAPPVGDSIKWLFHDRDMQVVKQQVISVSAFGTSDQSFDIPAAAPVGQYFIDVHVKRQGQWLSVAQAWYRVAEYRPPEFLVDVTSENRPRFPGDTLAGTVQARYLFGAPMGRAALTWSAQVAPISSWELQIPGTEGWHVGENGSWYESSYEGAFIVGSGTDTLDASGARTIRVAMPNPPRGRAARVSLEVAVSDVNRQVAGARTSSVVHPAALYIAAKPAGANYFWTAGTPQVINVMAVRPEGGQVNGVAVNGFVVRRAWHQVRRARNGISETVGEWVSDTVSRCSTTTRNADATCEFTPREGGVYTVTFTASDSAGRTATTSIQRWVTGTDWVPWNDESQFRMDVIPDRQRYSVGDTAIVMFASPFTDAEAWITIEREGLIEQRQMRLTSGSTTLRFPITETYAPNVFISILVARGRSAPPGPADDPGRPTIRVGYAQLRVTPEVKRLAIALQPDKQEYRPGDSARVNIRVRNAAGGGERSEVTLWAVDEGVLALTGYRTPDPLDLIYRERGLGMRLASNMTSVAPQVPEGEKGRREAGGGGGADAADVLRSRFQTTAFFLGSVITDAQGNATAVAKLPDNLTTFRLMSVAVTAGDRYGNAESSLLVTRPLLARPALPRFVRPGDDFIAGAVINRRDGIAATVRVRAQSTGVDLRGGAEKTATLEASRGAEVRFPFRATRGDSATFRFDVSSGADADAVRLRIPVRPDHHPTARVVAGVLHDTASVVMSLPATIDPARSRLSLNIGASPLAMIRGIRQRLQVYPYYCTEQMISALTPIIALQRAQQGSGAVLLEGNPLAEIQRGVEILGRRQRADGGIGYWSSGDWSTAWLSAYVGLVMLDAREVGAAVDTLVLTKLADYVSRDLHAVVEPAATPLARWYERRETRLRDQVAAVDFLSRMGRADVAAENELVRTAALLSMEDRARLAEVLMRRNQVMIARQLITPLWSAVRVEGKRAVLPDSAHTPFYFESRTRPMARLLMATLAVEPAHALVGPMVEALAQQGRAQSYSWNTQDYAAAVQALSAIDRRVRSQGERSVRVRAGNRVVLQGTTGGAAGRDSSIALAGLLASARGARELRLSLDAAQGTVPVYYYLTVTEVPSQPPVTPLNNGIQVERWYENYPGNTPVSSVMEGDLVRVRLRITVPSTREFVILDDALPAGLEAVDLSLRTASALPGPGATLPEGRPPRTEGEGRTMQDAPWGYGSWDSGWWSPFDHREMRDDRVIYSATVLWAGTYTATYLARATTAGTFVRPPAHAEEMYNPGVNGRSDGGKFVVTPRTR